MSLEGLRRQEPLIKKLEQQKRNTTECSKPIKSHTN